MPIDTPTHGTRPLQIGRYQVLDRLGTGGMGTVYKAFDLKRGREVALKVLAPEQAAEKPLALQRFRLEARFGRRFNHENVVSFYHYGTIQGIHYLALEYVDGVNLHEYVNRKGQVDVDESIRIMIQATRAIDHLFAHGIIHRDIKPSNFIVTRRKGKKTIKLIDLGLARRLLQTDARMTLAGSGLGTVDYISPEQARNASSADIRSDIYSLGCTWYHLLAGRAPFGEGTIMERAYKQIQLPPPDIREFNPEVRSEVKRVLEKMLAKDPGQRYQTPGELLQELVKLGKKEQQAQESEQVEKSVTIHQQNKWAGNDWAVSDDAVRPAFQPGPPRRVAGRQRFRGEYHGRASRPRDGENDQLARNHAALWIAAGLVILACIGGLAVVTVFWDADQKPAQPESRTLRSPQPVDNTSGSGVNPSK
jgi:serine/threonine protein kinase